jgi:hypothetical protein
MKLKILLFSSCGVLIIMNRFLLYSVFALFFSAMNIIAHVTKVIVPMAGLGTRLLPLTKAGSKSMVALVDRPALHHVVDEALQSGIYNFCFIINEDERHAIEHYFSPD